MLLSFAFLFLLYAFLKYKKYIIPIARGPFYNHKNAAISVPDEVAASWHRTVKLFRLYLYIWPAFLLVWLTFGWILAIPPHTDESTPFDWSNSMIQDTLIGLTVITVFLTSAHLLRKKPKK